MTDAEWQRWQKTFQQKEGVMPHIEKRLRRDRIGFVFSQALFGTIALGEVLFGGHQVLFGKTVFARLVGMSLVALMAIGTTIYVTIGKGLWRSAEQTPEAYLAWMERFLGASEKAGQLARWGGVVACLMTLGFVTWGNLDHPGTADDIAISAVVIVVTFGLTWFMPVLVRRKIAKRRAQIAAWRKELEA